MGNNVKNTFNKEMSKFLNETNNKIVELKASRINFYELINYVDAIYHDLYYSLSEANIAILYLNYSLEKKQIYFIIANNIDSHLFQHIVDKILDNLNKGNEYLLRNFIKYKDNCITIDYGKCLNEIHGRK